ncbi:MAG: glycosyltransferase family 8 protein [Rickettsiales bacterium]|jgi:lipopolysaccharide biosynthesis glycosyltransferase|nr:glycosyltransferase family 8 protein [Rickettsiales bacterium]
MILASYPKALREEIHVALACNDAYAYYCAETIVSLLLNSVGENLFYRFYIVQRNLLEENKRRIAKLRDTVGDCTIEFIEMGEGGPGAFRDPMYYRLKLASLLPDLDRVIYTDCDVTFLTSLGDLWHEDIDAYYSGNCIDFGRDRDLILDHFSRVCGVSGDDFPLSSHEVYFNSGFMLMNLAKIRDDGVEGRVEACLEKYPNLLYGDQDVINLVYQGKIKPISFRWSFLISYYTAKRSRIKIKDPRLLADLEDSAKYPRMVHFLADKKPDTIYRSIFHIPSYWIVNGYKKIFWEYVAHTDWKGEKTYRLVYRFPLNFLNRRA